jgi:hypothetical protein
MLLRPKLAGLFSALVASATLLLWGCSSSSPRDINYGTDVGVGFVPPDVSATSPDIAAPDATVVETGGTYDSDEADEAEADEAIDAKVSTVSADGGVDAVSSFDTSVNGAD